MDNFDIESTVSILGMTSESVVMDTEYHQGKGKGKGSKMKKKKKGDKVNERKGRSASRW